MVYHIPKVLCTQASAQATVPLFLSSTLPPLPYRYKNTGCLSSRGMVGDLVGMHKTGQAVPIDLNITVCPEGATEDVFFIGYFRSRKEETLSSTACWQPHSQWQS